MSSAGFHGANGYLQVESIYFYIYIFKSIKNRYIMISSII